MADRPVEQTKTPTPATKKLLETARELPQLPGVYLMKDKHSAVIYVGKASKLKNRVSSYFSGTHDLKTQALVSRIADFDVIVVGTEFEALVLESSLIKHHMPKYNILMRDDKGYPFIRVDLREDYPTFKIMTRSENDGATYLGPYHGRTVVRDVIAMVSKALKLPTCGKDIKRIMGKERPCLNFHIGACKAYCQHPDLADDYREAIAATIDVLQGKTSDLIEKLTHEMNEASECMAFELAAQKRDRLRAVQSMKEKQFVIAGSMADTDVVGYFKGAAKSCFVVMHYIGGKLISKDFELFDTPIEDDSEAVSALVRQYYQRRGFLPKTIYLPVVTSDCALLEQLFTEQAQSRVYVISPQRGDKAKIVETANINAREEAERASTYEEKILRTHEWIAGALKLSKIPSRIEAYDISNTQGTDVVGAMTVFERGKPYKKDYRRFKIKTIEGQNDVGSIAEVVSRRMARYSDADEHFSKLPDIMLIDGGAVHAATAKKVLDEAGIALPVLGMVKDDRHKTRALVTPEGEEIGIQSNPAVFALIGTIQEETHRFAVEFHRSLRSKGSYKSKLDEIEGVGEKRRNALIKHFGSLRAVKSASVEELAQVVPMGVAQKVYAHFHM
ncbi:MAG: excinuclease ABC subunit UvrC [Oscillospiraceae bacterium]|nr:excinuclease ABC subunit UvrC [Oscillospiraceae bacterium]